MPVSLEKMLSVFFTRMESHVSQVLYFPDGASLSVKLDFRDPLTRPLAHPNPGQLYTEMLWGNLGCVHNLRVKLRNRRTIAKQLFQVAEMEF